MAADLARLLLDRFRWIDDRLRAALVEHGFPEITHAQSLVMGTVDADGTRTSELARRLGVSRQAAHQSVRDLERAGFVTQVPDPSNASAKLVVLTDRGWASVEVARATFERLEREVAARVGEADAAAMRRALSADWGDADAADDPSGAGDGHRGD